jgi:hypothetical protein
MYLLKKVAIHEHTLNDKNCIKIPNSNAEQDIYNDFIKSIKY